MLKADFMADNGFGVMILVLDLQILAVTSYNSNKEKVSFQNLEFGRIILPYKYNLKPIVLCAALN